MLISMTHLSFIYACILPTYEYIRLPLCPFHSLRRFLTNISCILVVASSLYLSLPFLVLENRNSWREHHGNALIRQRLVQHLELNPGQYKSLVTKLVREKQKAEGMRDSEDADPPVTGVARLHCSEIGTK